MNMKPQNSDQAKKADYAKPSLSELNNQETAGGSGSTNEGAMMTALMRKGTTGS